MKQLTLGEKWALDNEAYEKGVTVKTSKPQCMECEHFIKGNVLHCSKYVEEEKPVKVFQGFEGCRFFQSVSPLKTDEGGEQRSRLLGAIAGFAVGDMMGVPVEFTSRAERDKDPVKGLRAYGTYHQPIGFWSDDTSLTLCLIDALSRDDVQFSLAKNMVAWYREALFTPGGKVFDIGNTTREAIERIMAGVEPRRCGGCSSSDNGNGSLMRILPLAFIADQMKPEELVALVNDISSFTHGHARSRLACLIYVEFAARLFAGSEKSKALRDACEFAAEYFNPLEFKEEKQYFKSIFDGSAISADRSSIRSTGYVIDTLEAAVWAFFNSESYSETVLSAVNLGGDTDTIAAIAGGLAGIAYGFSGIPEEWVQCMAKKESVFRMIEDFAAYAGIS